MPDEPLPDWIKRRLERESQGSLQAANRELQRRNGEFLIEKHAAEFCENFLRSLEFNLKSLSALRITALLTPGSTPEKGPQIYGVNLQSGEPYWKNIHATIQFQLPHGNTIQCSGEGFCIEFRLVALPAGDGIGAVLSNQFKPLNASQTYPLNAKQTAEQVAQEMANQIRPE